MLWNFHISGDIYNGTDYFMTARSMSVRNANRENPTIKRAIVNGKTLRVKRHIHLLHILSALINFIIEITSVQF